MNRLVIKDLHVSAGDKQILKGIDLEVNQGEIHAIMGPNGNGKSTLLSTIMGHPAYTVTSGSIEFNGEDVLKMSVDERSRKGLFLAMQYPKEIAGVTNSDFLRAAINSRLEKNISLFKFIKEMEGNISKLKMKEDLAHRFVNDGFSGGEKKRNEILQMMMLHPSIAMLDEIDSGLDVDAIKLVSDAILDLKKESDLGLLIVSHYERFFTLIKPTHSHVIVDGRIVVEGDDELVYKIDNDGYDWLYEELKIQPVKEERPLVYSLGVCARNPRSRNA
ncbi:MAG: Fe-S cluster assembly ATPase SufC [Erysipelotrichaceae bacterium]|nr:Fe-S cluster assembly ATPase SufC [Erysipelotrichaceae bacterium]MBP5280601.1 Fe-S cluster assembly ATPase SufC [Erysipelotrichaceae bacterium]